MKKNVGWGKISKLIAEAVDDASVVPQFDDVVEDEDVVVFSKEAFKSLVDYVKGDADEGAVDVDGVVKAILDLAKSKDGDVIEADDLNEIIGKEKEEMEGEEESEEEGEGESEEEEGEEEESEEEEEGESEEEEGEEEESEEEEEGKFEF